MFEMADQLKIEWSVVIWNSEKLYFSSGKLIHILTCFIGKLSARPMDDEIWMEL